MSLQKIRKTTIERGVRMVSGSEGDLTALNAIPIVALKQKRDQEKQVLHQLNDRFAKYIDRVKFLEGQNKKLLSELEELRQRWGEESRQVKDRYEPELLEARATIDDRTREKAISEIRAKRSEYEAANLKRQYDDAVNSIQTDKNKMANLEYLLHENQVELEILRRQLNDAEVDIEKYKKEVHRLNDDLQRLLFDLDQETLKRVRLENEKQTLEEQIPFLNAIHEQEMAEVRSLQAASNLDPAQFYRHELERAIRDIRSDFDDLNQQEKHDIEEFYKVKVEEITRLASLRDQTDNKLDSKAQLKTVLSESYREINDLKGLNVNLINKLNKLEEELETARHNNSQLVEKREREVAELRILLNDLMGDYDQLMNNKASLEFEINTYRRLLENEESRTTRINHVLSDKSYKIPSVIVKSVADNSNKQGQHLQQQQQISYGSSNEILSKTTFQRSAKGPVSISECSPDGKLIVLENTSRNKDINLSNWVLKRQVDSKEEIVYKFPSNFYLKANMSLKLWARGHGQEKQPSDLVNKDTDNWGIGHNILTSIINEFGEECATHLKKTITKK
jgi:intermediate filament protein if